MPLIAVNDKAINQTVTLTSWYFLTAENLHIYIDKIKFIRASIDMARQKVISLIINTAPPHSLIIYSATW